MTEPRTEPTPVAMAQASVAETIRLARPTTRRLAVAIGLGAAAAAAGIALLATSAWLISRASEQPSIADLGLAIVAVRFLALSRGLFRYGERLVGHDAAFRILADVRTRIYERLERLAPCGLGSFHRGDLLTRLVSDVDALQDVALRVLPAWIIAAVVGLATVGVLWWLLPSAALTVGLLLLACATVIPAVARKLAQHTEARRAPARGELNAAIVDLLEGAPDLVAFGATGAQLNRIAARDTELTDLASASARTAGVGSGLTTLAAGLATWGAVALGVSAVHDGRLDGVMLAVVALIPLAAFELVIGLPAAAQSLEGARRSTARIDAVLDAPVPVREPESPVATRLSGEHAVRIRGLRARYGPEAPWALDGVDLDLSPGRRVALVGPSGAGKTTLAAVLVRFVEYTGSVTLDGTELQALAADDVRRMIGLVEQDPHIFDSTIRENLRLARPAASDAELRSALARARLLPWIDTLPLGLDTAVGEHGARLSGGQRQRLALARAVLADFPIVVLDEPGEHLDVETADALMTDLLSATEDRTTLIITHRASGLDEVDEIVVLDRGRIIERIEHARSSPALALAGTANGRSTP
jgi:thiol reductant ABC exporter CydC subunit